MHDSYDFAWYGVNLCYYLTVARSLLLLIIVKLLIKLTRFTAVFCYYVAASLAFSNHKVSWWRVQLRIQPWNSLKCSLISFLTVPLLQLIQFLATSRKNIHTNKHHFKPSSSHDNESNLLQCSCSNLFLSSILTLLYTYSHV